MNITLPKLPDPSQLSERQKAEFCRRAEIVNALVDARNAGEERGESVKATDDSFMRQAAPGVSLATLHNWLRAYWRDGLAGLIDLRWKVQPQAIQRCGRFLAEVGRLYRGPGLHSMEVCHYLASETAQREGWPVCTIRETKEFIRRRVLPAIMKQRPGAVRRISDEL